MVLVVSRYNTRVSSFEGSSDVGRHVAVARNFIFFALKEAHLESVLSFKELASDSMD